MNNHEKKQDEQLKRLLERAHQNVDIPDHTQSWLKVKKRLDAIQRRQRWKKRFKIAVLVTCTSLIIGFAMTADLPTAYSKFTGLLKKVQEDITNIFFESPEEHEESSAKTTPPPSDGSFDARGNTRMENVTLEVARDKAGFRVLTPSYTPTGYDLDIVRIFQDADGGYRNILMEYVNAQDHIIQLSQRLVRDEATRERTTIQHHEANMKDMIIHGQTGMIITTDNDLIHLEWLSAENIKFTLFGTLPEQELILMAESLQ